MLAIKFITCAPNYYQHVAVPKGKKTYQVKKKPKKKNATSAIHMNLMTLRSRAISVQPIPKGKRDDMAVAAP
jgi:hypothetical protein